MGGSDNRELVTGDRTAYRALARSGVDPVRDHADAVTARVAAQAHGAALGRALAGLAARDRDVLLLVAYRSLSYNEVALALNIPAGTVRSRLHRARASLHRALTRENVRG